jgi:hypothetical protein
LTVIYPIKGSLGKDFRITSPFGIRRHPITGAIRKHNGVDLVMVSGKRGEPILAPEKSLVLESRRSTAAGGGYGYFVKLKGLETGTEHILAHMVSGSLTVKKGETIPAGHVVGNMGTTGASTGVHLHWETRVNNKFVDPIKWIEQNSAPSMPANFKAWVKNNNDGTASAYIQNAPRLSKVRVRQNGEVVFNKTIILPRDLDLQKNIRLVSGKNRITIEVDDKEVKGVTYNYRPQSAPTVPPARPPAVPQAPSEPRYWTARSGNSVRCHFVNAPVGAKVRVRHDGESVYNRTIQPSDGRLEKTVTLKPGRNRITLEVDGQEVRGATYNRSSL